MFGKKEDLEKEIQKVESEAISSIIDKSMTITGEIQFKGKTRIDGKINGNITGEHLILSKDGEITGDVKLSSFVCQGKYNGNIESAILTVKKGSSIKGKIVAGSLTVEPGSSLDGQVQAATSSASKSPGLPKTEKKEISPASK